MNLCRIFAKNLRAAREYRQFSQGELASRSGVSRGRIANMEREENPNPGTQLQTVEKLAKALRFSPHDMLLESFDPAWVAKTELAKRAIASGRERQDAAYVKAKRPRLR